MASSFTELIDKLCKSNCNSFVSSVVGIMQSHTVVHVFIFLSAVQLSTTNFRPKLAEKPVHVFDQNFPSFASEYCSVGSFSRHPSIFCFLITVQGGTTKVALSLSLHSCGFISADSVSVQSSACPEELCIRWRSRSSQANGHLRGET